MKFDNSDQLNQYMAKYSNGVCLLSFSVGKDSLVAWLVLRRYFKRIIPFYCYRIPGLRFMEKNIKYYEDFFQTQITQVPHPALYKQLNNLVFQAPENCHAIENVDGGLGLWEFEYDDLHRLLFEDFDLPSNVYVATGITTSDNMQRRISLNKNGAINTRRRMFYPIYDFRKQDLIREIEQAGVKLPSDYRIFGRSFDGLYVQFLEPLKEHYPEDYERVLEFFPQAELDILRHKWRREYYANGKTVKIQKD